MSNDFEVEVERLYKEFIARKFTSDSVEAGDWLVSEYKKNQEYYQRVNFRVGIRRMLVYLGKRRAKGE